METSLNVSRAPKFGNEDYFSVRHVRIKGVENLPVVVLRFGWGRPAAFSKIHGMAYFFGSYHLARTELLGQRFGLGSVGCTDTDCHVVGRGFFAIV